jgi:hypothetical protein
MEMFQKNQLSKRRLTAAPQYVSPAAWGIYLNNCSSELHFVVGDGNDRFYATF